jgi:hypothetical protein
VEFVSDKMTYIMLTDRSYGIFVLNIYIPIGDKSDDTKEGIYLMNSLRTK